MGGQLIIGGLIVAFVGAIVAAQSMTHKAPKGAPPEPNDPSRANLYIDPAKTRLGLWLIALGTLAQIVGTLIS